MPKVKKLVPIKENKMESIDREEIPAFEIWKSLDSTTGFEIWRSLLPEHDILMKKQKTENNA
jgi:hypothetical protein